MNKTYPLSLHNDRVLPSNYAGPAFVWDIDKTYLATHFSSWRGLLRIPIEFAIDKRAVPGMPELLRGLRRGRGKTVACHPIYFISASPPFLRRAILGKMLRDGVEYDGVTFKDWFRSLLQGRPDRWFDQLAFKLSALLSGRMERLGATEYLFGDDYERDAEAFILYAGWLAGQWSLAQFEQILTRAKVRKEDRRLVLTAAQALPAKRGQVRRIFIHLEKGMSPARYAAFTPRLVPVKGAYQLALTLLEMGLIDRRTLHSVRTAVSAAPHYRFSNFKKLEEDARKRKIWNENKSLGIF